MMGATLRQETELSMKGGGLEICWFLSGVCVVEAVFVFAESSVSVECTEVWEECECWVETVESEKESKVSESEVFDGVWEGGAERWRAIFSKWAVGGLPPLRFLPMLEWVWVCFLGGDAVAMWGRGPTTAVYGGTTLPRRLTCGRWCPVGERWERLFGVEGSWCEPWALMPCWKRWERLFWGWRFVLWTVGAVALLKRW